MMGLVAGGLSNKEIERQLDMTEGTIKLHLNSIFRKMRVKNRTTLAALALRFQQWQNRALSRCAGGLSLSLLVEVDAPVSV
jgi:hypothetical protein